MSLSKVPVTSTTLMRVVADSQHARWAVFYSRYQPIMRSYLCARFPSVDADDVIQETFSALAKLLPDYKYDPKKKGAFHNYLTGVLEGTFRAVGTNVTMRLKSCILRNHAAEPLGRVGICYDLQDGAGLDLPELDEPDDHGRHRIKRSGSPTRLTLLQSRAVKIADTLR